MLSEYLAISKRLVQLLMFNLNHAYRPSKQPADCSAPLKGSCKAHTRAFEASLRTAELERGFFAVRRDRFRRPSNDGVANPQRFAQTGPWLVVCFDGSLTLVVAVCRVTAGHSLALTALASATSFAAFSALFTPVTILGNSA